MAQHDFKKTAAGSIIVPNSGYSAFYFDLADGYPKYKDDAGAVHPFPGSLVWHGAYNGGHAYVPNDIVLYNDSSYINIVGCTGVLPTNPANWDIVALTGTDGISFIWRGAYAGGTPYVPNDVVSYNNSTYINILGCTGVLPTNPVNWSLMALAGAGDVVGPTGAVSNHVALFDGATGKLIKDSGKSITESFNVMDYGAIGNGIADDTTAIQDTINAAAAAFGGEVYFPVGHYKITSTLTVSSSGIKLQGEAGGHWMNVAGIDYTTQKGSWIHWMAAGAGSTMLQIEPVAGASALSLKDIHILDLCFDGRNPTAIPNPGGTFRTQALIGISMKSVSGFHISCVYIQDCSTVAFDLGVIAGVLGEAKCCRNGNISRLCINQQDELAAAGICVRMDGSGTTNTNMNTFTNCQLFYKNGNAIQLKCCQYNQFLGVICERYSGAGVGVVFEGSNTALNLCASSNQFFGGSAGAGGCIARGTLTYTYPSFDNAWWGYVVGGSIGLGESVPVIEVGAYFQYTITGAYPGGTTGNQTWNSKRPAICIFQGSGGVTSGVGETLLHKATIPGSAVMAGDAFRIKMHGISSSTGTLIFRIRIGVLGTIGDTQSWISVTSAAQVANSRAGIDCTVYMTAVGAGGSARAEGDAICSALILPTVVAAQANTAINTTSIWYIDVTCTCSVGTYTCLMCVIEAL